VTSGAPCAALEEGRLCSDVLALHSVPTSQTAGTALQLHCLITHTRHTFGAMLSTATLEASWHRLCLTAQRGTEAEADLRDVALGNLLGILAAAVRAQHAVIRAARSEGHVADVLPACLRILDLPAESQGITICGPWVARPHPLVRCAEQETSRYAAQPD
jgi:hypothetical protein